MTTVSTKQLKVLGASFGEANAEWAKYATIGNRQFVRCYQVGEHAWEESSNANPISEWVFTREDGKFHAKVTTTLAEAKRIASNWNNECPFKSIAEISNGLIVQSVAIQLSLIAV